MHEQSSLQAEVKLSYPRLTLNMTLWQVGGALPVNFLKPDVLLKGTRDYY